MRTLLLALLGLLALLAPALAAAQAAPTPPEAEARAQYAIKGQSDFDRYFLPAFQAVERKGKALGQRLAGAGSRLFWILALGMLSWQGIKLMLEGRELAEAVGELVVFFLSAGLVFGALSNWGEVVGRIDESFHWLAAQATDLPPGEQAPLRGLELALDPAFSILNTAFQSPGLSFSTLADLGNTFASTGFWLASFLMKLLIVAFILFSGLVYIAMYIISMVLFYVAAALGPVMIPWVLFAPMSFLFDGWVRFVISASLYKVVGLVMIALSGAMYEPLMQASAAAATGGSQYFNFTAASAALLISGAMALLMLQVPVIAGGLTSGIARALFNFRTGAGARMDAAAGRAVTGAAGSAIRTAAALPVGAVIRGTQAAAGSAAARRAAALGQGVGSWRPVRELAATYRAGRDALAGARVDR